METVCKVALIALAIAAIMSFVLLGVKAGTQLAINGIQRRSNIEVVK